ncbi:hypothetical protein RRG08_019136 [Elysia crispata]|uniref:Uncharacterized protein n=1 Tax=Elysia crispata TaxID=231223 RepID=A0AAE0YWI1_9GAST|nr:hypothetical protein RRG08_019136 [Elysia crispata]
MGFQLNKTVTEMAISPDRTQSLDFKHTATIQVQVIKVSQARYWQLVHDPRSQRSLLIARYWALVVGLKERLDQKIHGVLGSCTGFTEIHGVSFGLFYWIHRNTRSEFWALVLDSQKYTEFWALVLDSQKYTEFWALVLDSQKYTEFWALVLDSQTYTEFWALVLDSQKYTKFWALVLDSQTYTE